MKGVGVARIKAQLSAYLARVKRGEEIVVSERGQPIAKIVPYSAGGRSGDRRALLARAGILELGQCTLPGVFLRPSPVRDRAGHFLKALRDEREETS